MIKALLIGCGNIGAGYDLDDDAKVWTHAKAYSLLEGIEFSVFDYDKIKAKQVADKYGAIHLENLQEDNLKRYDIVSITTPTTTHFYYLEKLLTQAVPVVICEKPIVNSTEQIELLLNLYKSGTSKVIVNYMRRFQEGYEKAKQRLKVLMQQQSLKGINVKYKRGFLNNASHAVDLLEYFFEQPFILNDIKYSSIQFDAFEYDPTLLGCCVYMDSPVSFVGVTNTSYPIFEVEIFFSSAKVVICHSGNDIRYYFETSGNLQENLDERQTGLLDTYMLPVIKQAIKLLNKQEHEDNFMSALRLNKEILRIIEPLKSKFNATTSN